MGDGVMKTQKQTYYEAVRKQGEMNETLMEMLRHPTHPLTKDELRQLIKKRPEVYGRYCKLCDNMQE